MAYMSVNWRLAWTGKIGMNKPANIEKDCAAARAVVQVGSGRGFVVEGIGHLGRLTRYVITAAHCLPERSDGQRLPLLTAVHTLRNVPTSC
jgi:hypothetical protein